MTDDLIARLRICEKYDPDQKEAADALEAKDRRIAELEDILKFAEGCVDQKNARIAELEAALKPFADVAWFLDKHADYETMTVDGEYIRAARAALGEKE